MDNGQKMSRIRQSPYQMTALFVKAVFPMTNLFLQANNIFTLKSTDPLKIIPLCEKHVDTVSIKCRGK